jgi:uncharacterized membrane protein
MERVERHVVVDRPLRMVYDQWTQFEMLPLFLRDFTEIRQLDDTHLRCRAWFREPRETEWEIEITEQEPDRRIAWKSAGGALCAGTVRFECRDDEGRPHTHVRVIVAWDAPRLTYGLVASRTDEALARFKAFHAARLEATGAWRGEIDQGVSQGQPL